MVSASDEPSSSCSTHTSNSANFDTSETPSAPSISQLFTDAALYKQVIEDPDRASLALDDKSIKDFAELVGKDLDAPEKTLAGRFAQLSVEDLNWRGYDGRYNDEPDTFSEEDSEVSITADRSLPAAVQSTVVSALAEDERAKLSSKLPADEIVSLLKEAFGELAPPEVEERLLIETDAALVQDVIVLGVIHVTTHRLAFHASLPESRPDLFPGNRVIQAGPAVIHRTGLHRKRRVWLELSQDFLCSFPSASEDDRIRPLKSFLLSSVKEVLQEDGNRPRYLRIVLSENSISTTQEVVIEFDTVEAARQWRRELTGAIFLFRRQLMSTLKPSDAEGSDGVKISIPLPCIEEIKHGRFAEMLHFITLTVWTQDQNGEENGRPSAYEGTANYIQSVQFALAPYDSSLVGLEQLVETSKKRAHADVGSRLKTKVVVDCASMTLKDVQLDKVGHLTTESDLGSREKIVCHMLGIPYSSEIWMTQARLHLGPITTGYLVVSPQWVGFWSRSLALEDERYRIRTSLIRSVNVVDPWLRTLPSYGLQIEIQGQSSLKFQFRSEASRNEALQRVQEVTEQRQAASAPPTPVSSPPVSSPQSASLRTEDSTASSTSLVLDARIQAPSTTSPSRRSSAILAPISRTLSHPARQKLRMNSDFILRLPKVVNLPPSTFYSIPPKRFVCVTIGSRGDVQPYIALGLRLLSEGHKVTIVTHEEYKEWIEQFGIAHRTAGGDPGSLMRLSVENKMFSPQFFKESLTHFRGWLDDLLRTAWQQCHDAEVILESPYTFAGVHIAEALSIPYFRVCTMPWSKTAQFPHPFISPPVETPKFNRISYAVFDNVLWVATSTQINRWRKEVLHLQPTDMSHSVQAKIPIIYNFSSSVVPKPLDWNELAYPSGYWFLDNPEGANWEPPLDLVAFMDKARSEDKPLVYIGFGSITVPNPAEVSRRIYAAVVKSGVRAIISKGWSARMQTGVITDTEAFPEECYVLDKVPHDWLFPKVDAAMHHGGAGTTSASLRAGIPTLIKPWFGDQFFWASRIQKLGAGLKVPSLRVGDVADALVRATSDRIMKEKAAMVGDRIRSEDGVHNAIQFMYVYLPRAIRTAQHQEAESAEAQEDLVGLGLLQDMEGYASNGQRTILTQ